MTSFSEPPPSLPQNNNNQPGDGSKKKSKRPFLILLLLGVLVALIAMLTSGMSSSKRFCDTEVIFGDGCTSCPEHAICRNGAARCIPGYSLVDGEFCMNRVTRAQYNFAKQAKEVLARQNYMSECGDVKSPYLTLGELVSRYGGEGKISSENARVALDKFAGKFGIKSGSGGYSTYYVSPRYFSVCFVKENAGDILVALVPVLLVCVVLYLVVVARRNTKKAGEMRERVVEWLTEARAQSRRIGFGNDDFLSLADLRRRIMSSGKWNKNKSAAQAQWKITVRLLEKDPRVSKTTVWSNGKNVTGFKLK